MRLRALLTAGALLAAGTLVAVTPAAAAPGPADRPALSPAVAVSPARGLTTATAVTVTGSGLPPRTEVALVQCDQPTYDNGDFRSGCSPLTTLTTSATGTVSTRTNPRDPVYRSLEYGDPIPVYCRADLCRFYLEWADAGTGELRSAESGPLRFQGSPATITATPATGLADGQRVTVTGTAEGSTGRYVSIVQASCFQLVQGSGCVGHLPLATVPLSPRDTFQAKVPVYRFLGDGTDCAEPFGYGCRLIAVVLGADGLPDDTFGVSRLGDPGAVLTFAS